MDQYLYANAVLSIFAKNYMELKKDLPIRPSEMGVLNIITGTKGPHTPILLSEMLRVSKPMITAHIKNLEGKGYVTKVPSDADKRAYYIHPTDKALKLVEDAKTELNTKLNLLIDRMGQTEFDALIRLTETANHVLEEKGE